ncbi:hypothetical protein DT183_07900 [Salmonella enterica subsp. enterica serovar London]|uniref:Uncharacterized protein n=2 Tax=Enterobacteriaceae TaxID=543 RepID=A0A731YJ29_SALET|nr:MULTISPECIES: hypothetical protein [Enterobacteriaceae]EBX9326932.1 hypothetical protein [Salmonella enterica subsp. enterica serovar London]PLL94411.1 hypothetical protein CWN68_22800 [Klebsiella michiganensis]EBZ9056801.1 hypothetical protein [Salmonella enterica subsp. enterica serovar London]MDW2719775.1 hypothetical protein [Klebsiella pasteurii]QPE00165.1 hypothetical protein IT784_16910 [Salmonella enterica subsp. enterica serovar Typhimurium]
MAQHRYKILSICVPYLFYPVPKKAFDSLNKNELSICPKDFITVYVVIDTEGSDKSDIFISLTEAKNKCLEKNNKVFNESKIPRLTLDLPSNWRQYIVTQNKPKLEYDIDDTTLLNEISNAEKDIMLSLLEERKLMLRDLFSGIKEDYRIKKDASVNNDPSIVPKSPKIS